MFGTNGAGGWRRPVWQGLSGLLTVLALVATSCGAPASPTAAPPATSAPPSAPAPQATQPAKPAAAATAAPAAQPTKPAALQKLTVAYSAIGGTLAIPWTAKEAGLFEKYGLDVELTYIASSSKATQSMLAKEIYMMEANGQVVVDADLAGGDLVVIASPINRIVFSLMVTPDIKSIDDLRGKTLGVSRFGASSDYVLRVTLQQWGLVPNKDVNVVQMGGIPEILVGMQSGGIAGGPLSAPTTLTAKKAGMHELADLGKSAVAYPFTGAVTTRAFLKDHRDIALAYLKAYVEGIYTYHTKPEVAKKAIAKYAKLEDPEVIDETYQQLANYFEQVPLTKDDGMQAVLDETAKDRPEAAKAKISDFVDNSLMLDLQNGGFIKSITGK